MHDRNANLAGDIVSKSCADNKGSANELITVIYDDSYRLTYRDVTWGL